MTATELTCEQCNGTWDAAYWFCPSDRAPLLLGRTVGGEWRLEARLGAGAMGAVYRARHQIDARLAAVKILGPQIVDESNPEVRRFIRESHARVRHENCVEIQDIGRLHDIDHQGKALWWIRMDHVEGATLQQEAAAGLLPGPRLLDLAAQLAAGLEACHRAGIIHRDLKPANLLLERATGTLKVADFGVALLAGEPGLTVGAGILGTPLYLSPERFQSERASERSDLFAVGVILYQLMTGQHPFLPPGCTGLGQLISRVLAEAPFPFPAAAPRYPAELEAIVLRLLEKQPDDRFPSAAALREALLDLTPLEIRVMNDDLGLDQRLSVPRRLHLADLRTRAVAAASLTPLAQRILRDPHTRFGWESAKRPFSDGDTAAQLAALADAASPIELHLRAYPDVLLGG